MGSSSTQAQLAAQVTGQVAQAPHAQLPEPVFANPSAYRAPGTPRQETLCALFAEALGVDRVGLDDDFFDLGGQSLNGIWLINLINKALGLQLSIDELFDFPTVAELDQLHDLAQAADAGPFESIWVFDHFLTSPPSNESAFEA